MTKLISIYGILLAAGESKRFHGIKQLACLGAAKLNEQNTDLQAYKQEALVTRACRQVAKANFQSHRLILGANASKILPFVPATTPYSIVDNWSQGMGATIATAMQGLSEQTSHVCIILADQVKLEHSHFNQLIEQAKKAPNHIVAARFNERLGAPCIFPAKYFADLASLDGDVGAKNLISKESTNVIIVDMPEAAVDIDTQDDLASLGTFQNILTIKP